MSTLEPVSLGSAVEPKRRFRINQKVMTVVFVALLIASTATAGYFYRKYSVLKKDPNKVAQDEIAKTVAAVGKLIVLPTGEQPTLATVSEPDKLRDQAFFANAKQGDKVLIYTNAKKAILYNPTLNKIVEVAPINIGPAAGTTTQNTGAKPAVAGAATQK